MIEIKIPKIGVEDGEVVLTSWEKEEGAVVEKNEIIASVETEKVNSDILAPETGVLKITLQQGESANMTDTIGYIVADLEGTVEQPSEPTVSVRKVESISQKEPIKLNHSVAPVISTHLSPSARRRNAATGKVNLVTLNPERIIGSPAAKRIARELGVNLKTVAGSGPEGAILSKDVYQTSINQKHEPATVEKHSNPKGAKGNRILLRQPLTSIRKTIARNMYKSLQQTAQMTLMGTISLDKMWPFFQQMKDDLLEYSIKPSWAAIFVKAIAMALQEHPKINASYENDELIIWEDINIGVAVSTEKGLVVPVIKNANKKSLLDIHIELKNLAERARTNSIVMEDLTGSTFTLTNVGSYGGELGTPILNTKELGILGIGAVTKQPIVNEKDEIVVGRCCYYNLTVDHQMVDGESAGLFIKTIKKLINSPTRLLLN